MTEKIATFRIMRTLRKTHIFGVVPQRPFLQKAPFCVAENPKPLHIGKINNVSVQIFENPAAGQPEPAAIAAANADMDRIFSGISVGKATLSLMAWGDTMVSAWHQRARRISEKLLDKPSFFTELFGGAYFAQGDEFFGIDNNHPQSAVPYFFRHFLDRIISTVPEHTEMLRENNFFFINGKGEENSERARFYAWVKEIAKTRNPDAVLAQPREALQHSNVRFEATFGLGPGCHVLFCEKANGPFDHLPFGKIALSRETRMRQDASYTSDFSHAFTLRQEMLWPDHINFLVTRANKADEVFDSFAIPRTDENQRGDFCPAREFQKHPNVHLYCSLAAGQRLVPLLQTGDQS